MQESVAMMKMLFLGMKANSATKFLPQMIRTITLKNQKNFDLEVVVIISGGVFKTLAKAS